MRTIAPFMLALATLVIAIIAASYAFSTKYDWTGYLVLGIGFIIILLLGIDLYRHRDLMNDQDS